ncbi:MAG: RecQ family ATP-dependent DNA helicase [Mycobacteriales bacterium]
MPTAVVTDDAALRVQAETHLRALAGASATLRDDQWTAIRALVVDRRRALVVQRTGWGKSAVYFVATALLRASGAGPTVIISPLLALMRNQIAAAERAGIHAVTVNSANVDEWREVYAEVTAGAVDVLLVSPERLNNPDFRDNVLPSLAASAGLVVVDEAHCISDWGHDFRPDYRRIRTLLDELPRGAPVLATTATANARVAADIAEQLGEGALVQRGTLQRDSLELAVLTTPSAAHRLAWLGDHLADLPGSGIIYTLTVAAAEQTTEYLRGRGYDVAAYSGQSDDAQRRASEDDLLADRVKALVATSALGMGFDKPDLGFVIHLGAPQSPIAYYQQVGRAGRAVDRAIVALMPGPEDEAIWRYFASLAFPAEAQVTSTLSALADAGRTLSTAALEPLVDLRRTRLEMMLKVLDVDGAVRRVRGGWIATGQPWVYDAERYARVAAARSSEQQAMRDYIATSECRMVFLRHQLDDPAPQPCGRCDNCGGVSLPTAISADALTRAQTALHQPGVLIEPRRMWPTGLASVGLSWTGRIPADECAETGRALGRLTDIGWGARLREVFAAPDADVADDLVGGLITVLAAWDWSARPAAIVTVESRSHPRLVSSIAQRIGTAGRLPILGQVDRLSPSAPHGGSHNSAQRVLALQGAFAVSPPLATQLGALGGPVLLVDDLVDTGWTITIVAALLRAAGASGVLPLVLAGT